MEQSKVVYGSKQTKIERGFAGNQVSGGYKFPTGGGFYYSESGGPSASISFTCPLPYSSFSVGVSLGTNSTTGIWVNASSTTKYYKLFIEKEVERQPYIVYTRRDSTQPWTVFYHGNTSVVKRVTAYAKAV